MKHRIRLIAIICIAILELPAGSVRADDANVAQSAAHSHAASGVIEKIADDKKTVSIQNDDIPGYMSAMTMDYSIKSPSELSGIKAGDKITFTLESTDSGLVAKDIKKSN